MNNSVSATLDEFSTLNKAVIDSSSVLYMHKSCFLSLLCRELQLFTPMQAAEETGLDLKEIGILNPKNQKEKLNYETDYLVIKTAAGYGYPVISDDREILRHAAAKGLPYFNSLMMLCFLLYRKTITALEYSEYLARLKSFAWYSSRIYEYAEAVHTEIMLTLS